MFVRTAVCQKCSTPENKPCEGHVDWKRIECTDHPGVPVTKVGGFYFCTSCVLAHIQRMKP